LSIGAAGRVTASQYSDHARRKFLAVAWSVGTALLVIKEHVHILDTILKDTPAPLNFVEEKLLLEAARNLQCNRPIVRCDALADEELGDDARLECGLVRIYLVKSGTTKDEKKVHTTMSFPVNARGYGMLPFTCVPRGTWSRIHTAMLLSSEKLTKESRLSSSE
jgi:hypothetical protein